MLNGYLVLELDLSAIATATAGADGGLVVAGTYNKLKTANKPVIVADEEDVIPVVKTVSSGDYLLSFIQGVNSSVITVDEDDLVSIVTTELAEASE